MAALLAVVLARRCREPAAHSSARRRPRRPSASCSPRSRGDQPAGRGAHLPVRLARRLVRRRPAGVSLQPRAGATSRSAGFIAAWTIGYGLVQAIAPSWSSPQRRRPVSREVPEARLWARLLTAIPARARAAAAATASLARPDLVVAVGLGVVRLRLRRDLVAALLSDPGLCRLGEGGRGCRLLLRGECRRAG